MARRAQLVSQHLENISRAALEKYQQIIRDYVKGRQGLYALYRKEKLYYVGLARNLRGRLAQHLHDRHARSWDRFSVYLTIGDDHLKEMESLVLRIVMPKGNRAGGGFARSQNLLRDLERRIKSWVKSELRWFLGRKGASKPRRDRPRKREKGEPVLAPWAGRIRKLRATWHRRKYKARVLRDGRVRYAGKTFKTPSGAGQSIRKKATNGWRFWRYERAPGDWMPLATLR